jgi:2-octaprenyl-6-methoxyphenol hydroxylase
MTERVDVAIVGGGPVGLALAGMLVMRGLRGETIAVIDAKPIEQAVADPRSVALSWGSRQLLSQVNAWSPRTTPITHIHVSRRGSFGRTLIASADYDLPALGYVARYGDVCQSLTAALAQTGVRQLRPLQVSGRDESGHEIKLALSNGETLSAQLMVQAEGGIFGEQAVRATQRDYGQTAIVATVHADARIPGRAFERFTDQGPLALLPQEEGYSLVWCLRPENAEALLALNDDAFLAALQQAFGQRVGRFTRTGIRHAYALGLNAEQRATARSVAIGNAAQTLHPVAGQGLNLGLRDASVLAQCITRGFTSGSSGSQVAGALEEFQQQRRADRGMTVRLTDLMARVFASSGDGTLTQDLLGASLSMIDVFPPAKRALAEQMMFGVR